MDVWGGISRGTGDTSAAYSGVVSNACGSSKFLTFLFRSLPVFSSLLHLRNSWKVNSANFALVVFSEARRPPAIRSPNGKDQVIRAIRQVAVALP
jgi:hypothetical protein